MDANKKKWLIRGIAIGVSLIAAIGVAIGLYFNKPGYMEDQMSVTQAISDSFFIVGVLIFSIGVLIWISSTGFFDIFGFAFRSFINFFVPRRWTDTKETYYEYKVRKAEKRKEGSVYKTITLVGAGMLLASFILVFFI